ncbi:galactose-binding domain-like protein [Mycena galopus ATCC 62051]|nr:galactose-binding domain-like protein [Mycena galopus ATCC 62051]
MTAKPSPRSYLNWFLDRFIGWSAGLPPASSSYTVQPVEIPLAGNDNIQLVADLYQPMQNKPPSGTILMLSPYGGQGPLILTSRIWACYGYNVLIVQTRGTFGSTGTLDPARYNAVDGPRVVAWMRAQPWYTGTFATIGASYVGHTQWALMAAEQPPEDMVAAIITVGPRDFSELIWGTGALWLPLMNWARFVAQQETLSFVGMMWTMMWAGAQGWISAKRSLPLADGPRAELGDRMPWLYETMNRPDIASDPYWTPMKQGRASETTKVPILLLSGWHDICTSDTIAAFRQLRDRNCTVALTVGPGGHLDSQGGKAVMKETLDWLEKYLAKRTKKDIRPSPVRINVTGANEWRWLSSWPPPTKPLELFLDSKGALSQTPLGATDQAEFTFDPHSPTPSIGGPFLFGGGGSVDDSALAKRSDVLSFTSAPLPEDVEVLGKPSISLLHSTDNPHVDLFVRLSEVGAGGDISHNLTEVYKRLDPSRAHKAGEPATVQLELSDCAHRFKKGTKIRLLVAGGCFPFYSFNLGSGEPQSTGTTVRTAGHVVHCGGEEGSKLVLPIA